MRDHNKEKILINSLFLALLPMQILSAVTGAVNVSVDNMIAGRFLGTEAMAAIGLFSPVNEIIWISSVIFTGAGILCGRAIGRGEAGKACGIFSVGVDILLAFSLTMTALCMALPNVIAAFLGAEGNVTNLLGQYMRGYAPGFIFQLLEAMLLQFLVYNGENHKAYIAIITDILLNTVSDVLFVAVLHLGVFGVGLATAITEAVVGVYMAWGFFDRRKLIHYQRSGEDWSVVGEMVRLGSPTVMMTLGITIKAYVSNTTMMSAGGTPAMAAMSVQGNLCCVLGAITSGVGSVVSILGSVYFGEKDQKLLLRLFGAAMRVSLMLSVLCAGIFALFARPIAGFYCPSDQTAYGMVLTMLLIYPVSTVFNGILRILTCLYQCQGQIRLVNGVSLFENLFLAAFVALAVPMLGVNAAWFALSASDIACILIYAVSVFAMNGGFTLDPGRWLKLPVEVLTEEAHSMSAAVSDGREAASLAEQITAFCREKGLAEESIAAGETVRRAAERIMENGFLPRKKCVLYVRCICRDNRVILRFRDNGRQYDPTPELGTMKESNYQYSLRQNTLSVTIGG